MILVQSGLELSCSHKDPERLIAMVSEAVAYLKNSTGFSFPCTVQYKVYMSVIASCSRTSTCLSDINGWMLKLMPPVSKGLYLTLLRVTTDSMEARRLQGVGEGSCSLKLGRYKTYRSKCTHHN